MDQRVALVTGAGSGIGEAIATRLAADGLHVVVTDRDGAAAAATAEDLGRAGLSTAHRILDVAILEDIDATFEWMDSTYGRCDVLVNNAGVARGFAFLDFPDEDWQQTLAVNVTGAFRCSQRAARLMVRSGWGRVINIGSVSGSRAGVGRAAYGTSKAAISGLTRQIAVELAPFGITANEVAPGPIDTPLARSFHSAEAREALCRLVPAGHYGSPESIAAAVSFLASDDAHYVNGHTLPVDGGMTIAGVLTS